jgi:hypothetical protein
MLRAPKIERVALRQIRALIDEAVSVASTTYNTCGIVEMLEDEWSGYVDLEMLGTTFRNAIDNAARAASDAQDRLWRIEGYIDSSKVEVEVINACRNVDDARLNIERPTPGASSMHGTGIGVSTIRRLVGKMMGYVVYTYGEGEVRCRIVVPVSIDALSW